MKKQNRIYPPNVLRMITAVDYITWNKDVATLHYCDGTTESAKVKVTVAIDFLDTVSAVQAQRGRK